MHFPSNPLTSSQSHAALAVHYFPFQFRALVTKRRAMFNTKFSFPVTNAASDTAPVTSGAEACSRSEPSSSVSSHCVCVDVQVTSNGACRGRRPRAPCLPLTTWTRESRRRPQTTVRRVCAHVCVSLWWLGFPSPKTHTCWHIRRPQLLLSVSVHVVLLGS